MDHHIMTDVLEDDNACEHAVCLCVSVWTGVIIIFGCAAVWVLTPSIID